MLGWIANIVLIIGCWGVSHQHRWALLLGAFGGFLWGIIAIQAQMWDLLTIEIILSSLQIRGYFIWGKYGKYTNSQENP